MADTSSGTPLPPSGPTNRAKAIDGFMSLLGERSFEQIGLAEVAGRAGLKLSQLRTEFGSTFGIYAAYVRDVDRIVLEGDKDQKDDIGDEPVREKLFDILMRRVEALTPYKEAIRSLARSARRNPGLAFAINCMAVRSQTWMLEAAGISASGPRGALRAQGAALMFGRVLGVWLEDEEEGLDRTMAALDRGLSSAARWDGFIGDLCAIPCALRGPRRRRRRSRDYDEGMEAA